MKKGVSQLNGLTAANKILIKKKKRKEGGRELAIKTRLGWVKAGMQKIVQVNTNRGRK